jgi:hypothetical protein
MNQRGVTNIGYLLTILLILASIFAISQIGPFYYSYYELRGEMDAKAVMGKDLSDARITEGINQVVKKNNIPANIEDLKINRFEDKIIISLEYEEVFYVDFGSGYDFDLWVFKFNPKVERPI